MDYGASKIQTALESIGHEVQVATTPDSVDLSQFALALIHWGVGMPLGAYFGDSSAPTFIRKISLQLPSVCIDPRNGELKGLPDLLKDAGCNGIVQERGLATSISSHHYDEFFARVTNGKGRFEVAPAPIKASPATTTTSATVSVAAVASAPTAQSPEPAQAIAPAVATPASRTETPTNCEPQPTKTESPPPAQISSVATGPVSAPPTLSKQAVAPIPGPANGSVATTGTSLNLPEEVADLWSQLQKVFPTDRVRVNSQEQCLTLRAPGWTLQEAAVNYGGLAKMVTKYPSLWLDEVPYQPGDPLPVPPAVLLDARELFEAKGFTVVRSINQGKVDFLQSTRLFGNSSMIIYRKGDLFVHIGWNSR